MKIDLSEVQAQKSALSTSVGSIKGDLTKARNNLSRVVSTDSLKGGVKDTINQKVSNYQIPLLDNYTNALDSIVSRYDGIIKLFKETVGETNDSAIINTEYLERVKQRMKDPIEGLGKISTRTQSIYSDISDIISLSNPSLNDVNTTYAKAQKSLDDTIKNMETFNNVILKTDTFDLIDMQNSELATLSGYAPLSYGNRVSRNYYKKTQFRNSVSEINTALHSNSQNVKYQNALAKQLAESKYSGKVTANEDLIDSLFNSYKNITKGDLYKDGKSYKKYLKSVLPALYAAYRFSRDKRGNTIILKETTKFGRLLDEYFKLGKSLDKSNKYKIVQYKNGELTKTFKSLMEKLGKTRYNEDLSKVFKTFTDTTKMRHKFARVTKSIVKTSGSLFKEGFIKEVTFNGAGKALWNASKAGGVKGLVQSAKEGLRNYKEGFKTASKFGKFLKGAAVVGVALDVVDTFSKIHDNSQNAKRQGLRGNEVTASVTTGFVIDAAKAAGTTVAATAAASAGAALAGVGLGLLGVATAPAWVTGAVAIGASAIAVGVLNWADKKFNVTDNLKKGANSLIKGMRGWFK